MSSEPNQQSIELACRYDNSDRLKVTVSAEIDEVMFVMVESPIHGEYDNDVSEIAIFAYADDAAEFAGAILDSMGVESPASFINCPECNGRGKHYALSAIGPDVVTECKPCHGTGKLPQVFSYEDLDKFQATCEMIFKFNDVVPEQLLEELGVFYSKVVKYLKPPTDDEDVVGAPEDYEQQSPQGGRA